MSEKIISTPIRYFGANNRPLRTTYAVTIVDRATGDVLEHCTHEYGHQKLPAFKACATKLWRKRGHTDEIRWSR